MVSVAVMTNRVALGRIGKAHGLQGAFRVWPYADNTERFRSLKTVTLTQGTREVTCHVQSVHTVGSHVVLSTDVVTTSEEVRRWLGGDVEVELSERITPEPGQYFHDQLIGLSVETKNGRAVGTLVEILESAANDVYVCRDGEREFMIPAVEAFIDTIDIDAGRMIIKPIPGMLE